MKKNPCPLFKKIIMSREEIVFRAQLAEQIDNHDDMFAIICELGALEADLTVEERNLFGVNQITAKCCCSSSSQSRSVLRFRLHSKTVAVAERGAF